MNQKAFYTKTLPWILLMVFFVVLYFLRLKPEHRQLGFIPDDAEAVLLVDSRKVASGLFKLALNNPHFFDEIMPDKIDGDVPEFQNPGINPLSKTAVFFYNDPKKEYPVVGICGALSSAKAFQKYISTFPDYRLIKEINENTIVVYGGQYAAFDKSSFVVLLGFPGILELDEANSVEVLNMLVDKKKNGRSLPATNENFNQIAFKTEQVSFWGARSKFRPNESSPLLGQANEIRVGMNFLKDEVEMHFEADLAPGSEVKINDIKALRSDFSFMFLSGILNKKTIQKLEGNIGFNIPEEIIKPLNGKFILAINGFMINENLEVLKPGEKVGFDNAPILPKVELVLGVENINLLLDILKHNQAFEYKNKYYVFKNANNPVYIKTEDNNVLITNNFTSLESTYLRNADNLYQSMYVYYNHLIMLDELPNRPDMFIVKAFLKDFKFEKFRLKCTEFKDNKLIGEGKLTFKNLDTHSLVELVRIIRMFSGSAMQAFENQRNI
ncbi:MAG: hypothetical protein ACK4K0_03610 [Flavobacteriales bacterium]